MKAIGKKINSMVRVLKRGQMVQNMTVNMFMAKNMEMEDLHGQMEEGIKGNIMTIKNME